LRHKFPLDIIHACNQQVENQMDKQLTSTNTNAQLLRINDVATLTTLSKSCINLWVSLAKFPEPITLCPTVKVWRLKDILNWIEEQSLKSSVELNKKRSKASSLKSVESIIDSQLEDQQQPLLKIVHG
jgi:predicted DNA-binding transcriptional regulator AlpA